MTPQERNVYFPEIKQNRYFFYCIESIFSFFIQKLINIPSRVDRWEFVYYRFAASIVLHRVALSDEWTHRRVHFSAPSFGRRTSISSAMLTWLAPRVSRARLASVDSRSITVFSRRIDDACHAPSLVGRGPFRRWMRRSCFRSTRLRLV